VAETLSKLPREWMRIFTDPIAHTAWATTTMTLLALIGTPGTFKEKAPKISEAIYVIGGAWAAVGVAWGYQRGKEAEGTVPVGRELTPTPVVPVVPLPIGATTPGINVNTGGGAATVYENSSAGFNSAGQAVKSQPATPTAEVAQRAAELAAKLLGK
jgi:hypothetical protein